MRIGIDVDGVLADFNSAYQAAIIKHTGQDLFGEGFVIQTWNYPEEQAGYNPVDIQAVWNVIKGQRDFWVNLAPYPRALHAIELADKQSAYGRDVYYITSRVGYRAKEQTEAWLRRLGAKNPTVLISHDKGDAAAALSLTHYIDDKAENVMSVRVKEPNCWTFLCDQTWNEGYVIPGVQHIVSAEAFLQRL